MKTQRAITTFLKFKIQGCKINDQKQKTKRMEDNALSKYTDEYWQNFTNSEGLGGERKTIKKCMAFSNERKKEMNETLIFCSVHLWQKRTLWWS